MAAKNELGTTRELTDQTVVTTFRVLGEAAKLLPNVAHDEPLKAFITVMAPFLGFAVSRTAQSFLSDRLPPFTQGVAEAFDNDLKKLGEHTALHEGDGDSHERLYRGFRFMQDAVDPHVVKILGYMTGRYEYAGVKADSFFRGLGRVLVELEVGEVQQLAAILRAIPLDDAQEGWYLLHESGNPGELVVGKQPHGPFPSLPRLLHLLKREAFAANLPQDMTWGLAKIDNSAGAKVPHDVPTRILDVIDPLGQRRRP